MTTCMAGGKQLFSIALKFLIYSMLYRVDGTLFLCKVL